MMLLAMAVFQAGCGALIPSVPANPQPKPVQTQAMARVMTPATTVRGLATRGAQTRTATAQVPSSDRASFDALPPGAQPKLDATEPAASLPALTKTPQPASPEPDKQWYGWQTLALDGVATVGFMYGLMYDQREVMWSSVALYGAGAPLVHLVQGEFTGSAKSLGSRVLLPAIGAGLGALTGLALGEILVGDDEGRRIGMEAFALIGAPLGALGAMALDASLFAWGAPDEPEPVGQSQLRWAPTFGWNATGQPTVGVAGQF